MKKCKIIIALMLIIFVMISAVACTLVCKHIDENLDHKCDVCSEAMGECADANKDHKCDYGCDKVIGTHKEATDSHNCAYCGEKLSDCTPNADDGDCTTAIVCSVCNAELTPAKDHVAGDDDKDCTTPIKCVNCDQNAVEASRHTPKVDDGDCTTATTCEVCGKVLIPSEATHTYGPDDGDCTTNIVCSVCNKEIVAAKQHNIKLYNDDIDGHHGECENDGCNYKTESSEHTRSDDDKCACGYNYADKCDLCGLCEDASCTLCENKCYFVKESNIVAPFVPSTTMENMSNSSQKWTMTKEEINGLTGVRYTSESKIDFKILNGSTNYCPLLKTDKVYYRLVIKNNGSADVEFRYQIEYFGVRGETTIFVPAGETVEALVVQNALGDRDNGASCHHRVYFKSGNENGYDLTIAGEVAVPKKQVKIEGAKINGLYVIDTAYALTLDPSAEISYDSENEVLGWEYNGTTYSSYEKMAAVNLNPDVCDTIKIVYGDAPKKHEDSQCSECGKCKDYTCEFEGCNEADRCQGHFDAESLKVMSFNICTGGYGVEANRNGVINRILSNMPDLLGTQEENSLWTAVLEDALATYGYKNVIMYRDGVVNSNSGNEGAGIWYNAVRFELLDWGYFWISDTPDQVSSWGQYGAAYKRVTCWAKLYDRASGKTFVYYNTHLGYESSQLFLRSAELMMDRMHQHYNEGLPVIVTGDFNFAITHNGGLPAYNRYMQALNDSHYEAIVKNYVEGKENTFSHYGEHTTGKPIDYILYSNDFVAQEYTIFREEFPDGVSRTGTDSVDRQYFSSDHFAIQTVFNFADNWGAHYCWDACEVCGNCLDADCTTCTVKCNHHEVCYKCGGKVILTSDSTCHWYACENAECDYKEDKEEHTESATMVDGYFVCSVCNKKYSGFDNENKLVVPYVPSTTMENMSNSGDKANMSKEEINGLTGVRFVSETKKDFKILNGAANYCPLLKNDVVYYRLVIKNNGSVDVEFRYQIEFFGVRGETTIFVPAGETVEALVVQAALVSRDNAASCHHRIYFNSGNDNGYDLTIAGEVSVPKKEIKIEGATINGSNVIGTAYGINTTLDANAEVVYDSTKGTNYGWLYNGLYYETYAEVAKVALDYYTCDTIKAVYAEDFTEKFVPSCKVEDKGDGSVLPTAEHVYDENGALVATRYAAVANEDNAQTVQLTNGASEKHTDSDANLSLAQLFKSNKNCFLLTFTNNSDKAVTFTYMLEGWGDRGQVTVELAAGETKTVQLVQGYNGSNTSASIMNRVIFDAETANAGYDITISGYVIIR